MPHENIYLLTNYMEVDEDLRDSYLAAQEHIDVNKSYFFFTDFFAYKPEKDRQTELKLACRYGLPKFNGGDQLFLSFESEIDALNYKFQAPYFSLVHVTDTKLIEILNTFVWDIGGKLLSK